MSEKKERKEACEGLYRVWCPDLEIGEADGDNMVCQIGLSPRDLARVWLGQRSGGGSGEATVFVRHPGGRVSGFLGVSYEGLKP